MNTHLYAKEKKENQRGAVLIWVAAGMVAFLGFAALAIDVGFLMAGRNELQNAADAAALAGASVLAREDVDSFNVNKGKIRQAAVEVAGLNIASNENVQLDLDNEEDVKLGRWDWDGGPGDYENRFYNGSQPYNAVKVEIDGHNIKTFFTPDFGLGASAVAVVGPIIGMKGLMPIGIDKAEWNSLKSSSPSDIYYFGKGEGNWGTVDLDGKGGGTKEIRKLLEDGGYDGDIYVGDEIDLKTGVGAINNNKSRKAVEDLIGEKIYIPVISGFVQGAGSVEVLGFCAVRIKGIDKQGSSTNIEAEYVSEGITSGTIDMGAQNFGAIGIKLVM